MIEKKKSPEVVGDLRPIAITPIFSKLLESIIRKQILSDIGPSLHKHQFGGLKGSSTEHYMSGLLQDVYCMKQKKLTPILLMWDFSSAFNCLLHQQVVSSAASLGVRQPLLRLLASYLSGRKTVVHWDEACSSARPCNGGSGQGTLLSVILFIIAVDQLIKKIEAEIEAQEGVVKHDGVAAVRLFVDDTAVLLGVDSTRLPTGPDGSKVWQDVDGRVSAYCDCVEAFSSSTGMRLNAGKTTALVFDPSVKFPVEVVTDPKTGKRSECQILESSSGHKIVKTSTAKLLGLTLDEGLKYHDLVRKKLSSANKALWSLRRLKKHTVNKSHLRSVYISYVRSTLEFSLPAVWPCLLKGDRDDLERVQKRATKIILNSGWTPLSPNYIDYDERLRQLDLEPLVDRWQNSFVAFAKKLEFDPRFSRYIVPRFTRDIRDPDYYFVPMMRTETLKRAPLRHVAIELNKLTSDVTARRREWDRKHGKHLAVAANVDDVG